MSLIYSLITVIATASTFLISAANPPRNVRCHGSVPRKVSEGEYWYHSNDSYRVRFTTNLEMDLRRNQKQCFEVHLDNNGADESNDTTKITNLFYTFEYLDFLQSYMVRDSYQFGIPLFRSTCKCDCPGNDAFCTPNHGPSFCKGPGGYLCVNTFHQGAKQHGCPEQGGSNLCCKVTVEPYEGRMFTAVNMDRPTGRALLRIEIYTRYKGHWKKFRQYSKHVPTGQHQLLHLNGDANVVDVNIRAYPLTPPQTLRNGDKYYFFEQRTTAFTLYDNLNINNVLEHSPNKFGWLRYINEVWTTKDPLVSIDGVHQPYVSNCFRQQFIDHYLITSDVFVMANGTGGGAGLVPANGPILGHDVIARDKFISKIELVRNAGGSGRMDFHVHHRPAYTPSLNLAVDLEQKMHVLPHVHESTFEDLAAKIFLDKNSQRYLNLTLVSAVGSFMVELYRDGSNSYLDLQLSVSSVSLPLTSNLSSILPLPNFISNTRHVCVSPLHKPRKMICKWAEFVHEPMMQYELSKTFIATQGNCPGCNEVTDTGSFLSYLDPRNWFNGIGSFSEGVAVFVEVVLYVLVFLAALILWRKCLWPLLHWALCSKNEPSLPLSRLSPRSVTKERLKSQDLEV